MLPPKLLFTRHSAILLSLFTSTFLTPPSNLLRSALRAPIHPVFRFRKLDLQAAETVEEDSQAAEVSVLAQRALVRGLKGRSKASTDEAGVAA